MKIKKIAVIGAGTMGAQIAVHIANHGFEIGLYARSPERLPRTLKELRTFLEGRGDVPGSAVEEWLKGADKINLHDRLEKALEGTDLVVEAVSENLEVKREVFALLDSLAPREAILSTTSSSIPISRIEGATQRPGRCLNLHFYQPILVINLVDILAGREAPPEVMGAIQEFVRSIGCVPLPVKKEIPGIGFARVLHFIYQQALFLWAGGYMDFRDMDRAWMIFTKMPQGPFGLMDAIGLDVVFDILMSYYRESKSPQDHPPQALKDMIDRNQLGRKTGQGFYTYPHPEFIRPDFLPRPL